MHVINASVSTGLTASDTTILICDSSILVQADLEGYCGWLGASEQSRLACFIRSERRRQFIVGRVLLRLALSSLRGVAREDLQLVERPGLAPLLASDPAVRFSISHSGGWVACAVGTDTALGLDIERVDLTRDVLTLAEHALDASEILTLKTHAPEARHAAFYRMWCAHEARFKLGGPSVVEYPLESCGLVGVLACASPLAQAPILTPVRLHAL